MLSSNLRHLSILSSTDSSLKPVSIRQLLTLKENKIFLKKPKAKAQIVQFINFYKRQSLIHVKSSGTDT